MLALIDKSTIALGAIGFYAALCLAIWGVVKIFPQWDARQRERRMGGEPRD